MRVHDVADTRQAVAVWEAAQAGTEARLVSPARSVEFVARSSAGRDEFGVMGR